MTLLADNEPDQSPAAGSTAFYSFNHQTFNMLWH